MIKYETSTGERVSQATIDRRLSEAYRERYSGGLFCCEGCGGQATCSAHIIAKARLKVLHLTEKIWDPLFFFPSCYTCNLAIENPKGEAWKSLLNLEECLSVIRQYDPELYQIFINNDTSSNRP